MVKMTIVEKTIVKTAMVVQVRPAKRAMAV